MNILCKGKTKNGEACKRAAGQSGYCSSHDPEEVKARELAAAKNSASLKKMEEVLYSIYGTCHATGWQVSLEDQDRQNWKYATIAVEKSVRAGFHNETVTGQFRITVDGSVEVSMSKTSFYGYGLTDLHQSMMNDLGNLSWLESKEKKPTPLGLDRVLKTTNRFHTVATQLLRRYGSRNTLKIEDEYDVQDLLHALLKIDFDDVRPEEYSPSKAGASSRLDFLLKPQKIVVEAKMASPSLTDKKIGEQLIVDIERYKAHPDCERLVCLVYDPGHHIRNPGGLERDLCRKEEKIEVHVVIVPK